MFGQCQHVTGVGLALQVPGFVLAFCDGRAEVFDQPFFVILNLAVGGNFDGDPKSDAIFPATMLVDFVRVYRRAQ